MTREIRLNLKILHIIAWLACALPTVPAWAEEDRGTGPAGGNVFVVTTTANSGAGSLRQAIVDANASGASSTIVFDIPGDGPQVIAPTSLLPAITVPTLVDGLSQDGANCTTWPPALMIELSGANLTAGSTNGLRLHPGSGGSVVRGLVIRDFNNNNTSTGLLVASNGNHVACNFIGTDVTGTSAAGNTRGITLDSSRFNVIGTGAGWSGRHERNLISGNDNIGIITVGGNASDNRISGNWIGTDVTGTGALGGSTGISIGAPGGTPTQNIVIGYDGAGDPLLMRNVISGNSGAGINLGNNTRRVHVAGNYIGLNAEGTAALANGRGIESTAGSSAGPRLYHLVGWDGTPGQRAAQRNVISGNTGNGVSIRFVNDTGNDHAVVGNWIGTDAQGQSAIPNGFYGLSLTGGSAPTRVLVHGNRIADNAAGGIQLFASSSDQHPTFWNGVDIPELPNLDSTNNCITDNGAGIARNGGGPAVAVIFVENWWGADNGPGGNGGGGGDTIPGAVTYQPFLTEPPEHCGDVPAAPALHLSPTELDFGDVEVGSTGDPLTVTVQNLGNATASPLTFTLDGPFGFDIDSWTCDPFGGDLPPDASCEIAVTFSPGEPGPVSGWLRSNAGGDPQAEIDLFGHGAAAAIDVDPESFNFQVVAGGQDAGTLTLGNLGDADLDWSVTPAETGPCNDPGNAPWLGVSPHNGVTPPVNENTVAVTADTTGLPPGQYQAQLCVDSNDPDQPLVTVPVELQVTAPELSFDPPELDFGEVEIGTGGATLAATLHNTGDAGATGLELFVNGDPDFSITGGDCAVLLPAGDDCQVEVTFLPSGFGPAAAALQAAGNESTAFAELVLDGIGVVPIAPDDNNVLYVDQNVTGGNQSGGSWENALPELTLALDWAADEWDPSGGDLQIWVAEGIYRPTDDETDLEASFVLVDGVAIYGGFAGIETSLDERDWASNPTVLSGEVNGSHVYNVLFGDGVGPDTRIDGFIVTGGHATSTQGGIRATGGGMHLIGSAPVLSDMIFTGNRARSGGGAYMNSGSTPLFVNVLFLNNEATSLGGGAVFNNVNSHATYLNCTFYGNTAHNPMFENASGGGMFNWNGSSPEIVNSIFWANTADEGEDQIHGPEGGFGGFTNEARIAHSIIEGGMPENTIDNGNNLFDDPLFTDAAGGDFTLQRESPAVNAGDPDTDLSLFAGGPADPLDLAVNPRVFPGFSPIIDIGAYELQDDPPAPQLAFDPDSVDFGDVEVGSSGGPLTIVLHNTGDAEAAGLVFSQNGDDFPVDTSDCGALLPVGESCEIEVTFSPQQPGPASAVLEAASGDFSAEAELTGTGTVAELEITPSALAFGNVPVGETSAPAALTLTSTGSATLIIEELMGPEAPFLPAGDDGMRGLPCALPPFSLEPGERCDVAFRFSPDEIGDAASTLTVIGNAPSSPDEVTLAGTGTAALIAVDPALFEFELVTGQSDTGTLAIGNAGNIDLDWTIAAESTCGAGDSLDWLTAAPPAGVTAPSGATPVEVAVDAQGLAAGLYDAVLCLSSNALGAPQTEVSVSLTVTAPDLFFDPPGLDFGDVKIGAGVQTLNAVLLNQGDSAATELDFLVPAGFDADTAACGSQLAEGDSCEIAVTFDPLDTGTVEGTLTVGSAKGATAELVLTGNGIESGALGADPDHLHFEEVVITRTRTRSFSVVNTAAAGGTTVELSSVTLESGGPAFAINGIDCVAGTVLAPGESCGVEISFTPAEVAPHDGTIRVTADDGQQIIVTLSGTVLPDEILADRFEAP